MHWAVVAALTSGCGNAGNDGPDPDDAGDETGDDDGEGDDGDDSNPADAGDDDVPRIGPTGLRRLSRAEYHRTLVDLVGPVPDGIVDPIPYDFESPFDNDYAQQDASATLVDGLFAVSTAVAEHILADPARREEVLGCAPTGPGDEPCLRSFAASLARRAFRRPVTDAEIDELAAFVEHAEEEGDFDVAATMVFQAVLMNAELLYRIETGEVIADDPSTLKLDDSSMATRLSYLLWGTTPDEGLLAKAEAGELSTPDQIRETAEAMLQDPRGLEQLQRFHAMWLDYDDLPQGSALEQAMRKETDKLVERVLMQGSWLELLTHEQSWLDPTLAEHYSLGTDVTAEGWVPYPDKRRAGILSHGAFLAVGEKFGDTSPTERGKAIWTLLLCRDIPPPPPDVDTGMPPAGGADDCKLDTYDMHERAECASCHAITDLIGFGLENYGPLGEWRTHETGRPQCEIDGQGAVEGLGDFAGAPSLGAMLADSGMVERCAAQRYLQYAIGRAIGPDEAGALDVLAGRFETEDDLLQVVLDLVGSEAFTHRVVED